MINNEKKTRRQEEFGYRWQNSGMFGAEKNGQGLFQAAGGFGKTYAAVNFVIKPYLESPKNNGDRTVIVVVPVEVAIKQWQDTIRVCIPNNWINKIRVTSVQALNARHKDTGEILEYDLLVVDEYHYFFEDVFSSWIDGTRIKFKHNLALTATPIDPHGRHQKLANIYPLIDKISVTEGIKEGYISRFVEFNYGLTLNPEERGIYDKISEYITERLQYFGDDGFDGVMKCVSGTKGPLGDTPSIVYATQYAQLNGWSKDADTEVHNLYGPHMMMHYASEALELVRRRKELINDNMQKAQVAVEILKKFPNMKTISFSTSSKYADMFAGLSREAGFNTVVYHSALTSQPLVDEKTGKLFTYASGAKKGQIKMFGLKTLKDKAIEDFSKGRASVLSTVSAMDASLNVEDIELGILAGRDSNFNKQKQRTFRVTRVNPNNPNQIVIIVNLYFRNTVDENWLKAAQKHSESKIYRISNVNDIRIEVLEGFELH